MLAEVIFPMDNRDNLSIFFTLPGEDTYLDILVRELGNKVPVDYIPLASQKHLPDATDQAALEHLT